MEKELSITLVSELKYIDIYHVDGCKEETNWIITKHDNMNDVLGWVNFYKVWKKLVFTSSGDRIKWDTNCLEEIIKFIKENEE